MSDLSVPSPAVKHPTPFHFEKRNGQFFKLFLKTILLSVVTCGIYLFWGRVAITKFIYSNTSFGNRSFEYHATGKELFIGFLKGIVIVGLIVAAMLGITRISALLSMVITIPLYIAAVFLLAPYLMIGKWRFFLSRSSYCNVRFKYIGEYSELVKIWIKSVLLTIITLGFYSPVLQNKVQKYFADNSRFGTLAFGYSGKNGEFFKIWLKGVIFSILTVGIYSFWFIAKLTRYIMSHTTLHGHSFKSSITGSGLFITSFVNFFIVVFTLGLGFPIAANRMYFYVFSNLTLDASPAELETVAAAFDKNASALASGIEEAANVVDALSGAL